MTCVRSSPVIQARLYDYATPSIKFSGPLSARDECKAYRNQRQTSAKSLHLANFCQKCPNPAKAALPVVPCPLHKGATETDGQKTCHKPVQKRKKKPNKKRKEYFMYNIYI